MADAPNDSITGLIVAAVPWTDNELRQRFLDSDYREVYEAMFDLSSRQNHVWTREGRITALRLPTIVTTQA